MSPETRRFFPIGQPDLMNLLHSGLLPHKYPIDALFEFSAMYKPNEFSFLRYICYLKTSFKLNFFKIMTDAFDVFKILQLV